MAGGKNVLVSTAGFSVLGNAIFWWKAKTKRLFSQCNVGRMRDPATAPSYLPAGIALWF
jgi:hypothetical protein